MEDGGQGFETDPSQSTWEESVLCTESMMAPMPEDSLFACLQSPGAVRAAPWSPWMDPASSGGGGLEPRNQV